MAKDKLIVAEVHGVYVIGWFLAEEGELGAYLGDDVSTLEDVNKAAPEDHEAVLAQYLAHKLWDSTVQRGSSFGKHFFWETESQAKKALREIRANMEAFASKKPWPEWALKAKEAGWKPPKGWKP